MKEKILLLKDADFVIMDSSNIQKSLSVLTQGNKIEAVGKTEDLNKQYSFDEILDCSGMALLPGFINCHTHINETMMRGMGHNISFYDWCKKMVFPMGETMEECGEKVYTRMAELTAMEAVASGTTSLIENSCNFTKWHTYAMARAMSDFGIRGAVAMGAEDFSELDFGHVSTLENEVDAVRKFLETWQAEDDELIQAWVGPGGGKRTVGGCTSDLLKQLKQLANSFNTNFHMHLVGSRLEYENVIKTTDFPGAVAYVDDLGLLDERTSLVHLVWIMEEEYPILKESGAMVVHCPSSAQHNTMGVQPLMALDALGIVCALATDGANPNDSLDMIREMRQAILLQMIHKMKPEAMFHGDAFRMATETGAKILGIENVGRIEKGCLADITAIRIENNPFLAPVYDPIETIVYSGSGGRDVTMTMVNGKIVYKNGEFLTVDAEKVISEINGYRKGVIGPVPYLADYRKFI
ncbi:amidohydrolase family protein [bacterium]|nr:amidohydrolase family protein [bacterium]